MALSRVITWTDLPEVDRPMLGKTESRLGDVLGMFIAIGVKTGTLILVCTES